MAQTKVWILEKESLAAWQAAACSLCEQYDHASILQSNDYPKSLSWNSGDCLIALGHHRSLTANEQVFDGLQSFQQSLQLNAVGYLSYDAKNEVEHLESQNPDLLQNPLTVFVEPVTWISFDKLQMTISSYEDPEQVYLKLAEVLNQTPPVTSFFKGQISCAMPRKEYLLKVEEIRELIASGNVYEMNLCLEFFSDSCWLDPYPAFLALMRKSPTPFAAYFKYDDLHVLSASPERFMMKSGEKLISQPIKGTRGRGKTADEDVRLKEELFQSEKDRAENVMIVDLVRNDLARSCKPGTVQVDELFGIYTFPQVHQMISSVSGELKPDVTGLEALRRAFPMGSMTGAPKVMAMKQIERLENSRRGVYSGALGLITPEGDYDFNVLIRTLVYRSDLKKLSFQAGGAITYDSVPEEEWEEIQVKASAIKEILH